MLTELFRLVIRGERNEGRTVEVAAHHLPCVLPQQLKGGKRISSAAPVPATASSRVVGKPPVPSPQRFEPPGSNNLVHHRRDREGYEEDCEECNRESWGSDGNLVRVISVGGDSCDCHDGASTDSDMGSDTDLGGSELRGNCGFWISSKNRDNIENTLLMKRSSSFGSGMNKFSTDKDSTISAPVFKGLKDTRVSTIVLFNW